MSGLAFDLDEHDDIGFVQYVRPVVASVLRVVEPAEVYVVKVDSWFGDKWLGFSNKALGAVGLSHRETLRVPPFVPARVVSQRFLQRRPDGEYERGETSLELHLEQASEDNARRLMSIVCPNAAVCWWSGDSRPNQRGCIMAYLPTPEGHVGWYAELKRVADWSLGKTVGISPLELSAYSQ